MGAQIILSMEDNTVKIINKKVSFIFMAQDHKTKVLSRLKGYRPSGLSLPEYSEN